MINRISSLILASLLSLFVIASCTSAPTDPCETREIERLEAHQRDRDPSLKVSHDQLLELATQTCDSLKNISADVGKRCEGISNPSDRQECLAKAKLYKDWTTGNISKEQFEELYDDKFGNPKAKANARQAETLAAIIEIVALDLGKLPQSLQQAKKVEASAPINDEWGRPYVYSINDNGSSFTLKSLGADGEPGGDGENQDFQLVRDLNNQP